MILVLDTSFNYLTVGCFNDNKKLIAGSSFIANKIQSEKIMPTIDDLFKQAKLNKKDLTKVVLTIGPGSYTGLRIALTIAKVLAVNTSIKIGTVNTMELMLANVTDGYAIMDARANRAYIGYKENNEFKYCKIETLDNIRNIIKESDYLVGQGSLIDRGTKYPDYLLNFGLMLDKVSWQDNPYQLAPLYYKDSDSYDTNKKS